MIANSGYGFSELFVEGVAGVWLACVLDRPGEAYPKSYLPERRIGRRKGRGVLSDGHMSRGAAFPHDRPKGQVRLECIKRLSVFSVRSYPCGCDQISKIVLLGPTGIGPRLRCDRKEVITTRERYSQDG